MQKIPTKLANIKTETELKDSFPVLFQDLLNGRNYMNTVRKKPKKEQEELELGEEVEDETEDDDEAKNDILNVELEKKDEEIEKLKKDLEKQKTETEEYISLSQK